MYLILAINHSIGISLRLSTHSVICQLFFSTLNPMVLFPMYEFQLCLAPMKLCKRRRGVMPENLNRIRTGTRNRIGMVTVMFLLTPPRLTFISCQYAAILYSTAGAVICKKSNILWFYAQNSW